MSVIFRTALFLLSLLISVNLLFPIILLAEDKPLYVCYYTSDTITVDGDLSEPSWSEALNLEFKTPQTGSTPLSLTLAGLRWNDSHLFAGFKAYDKDIGGTLTERDSSTFKEDVLEIFLKPDPYQDVYYNFEINALGTVFDARNSKSAPWRERKNWNCEGLLVSIKIEGTLNKSDDEDEYWQMEAAIPWSELDVINGAPPASGDAWLFHLARYDYSRYLPDGKELSSCAPLTKADFHDYREWITLKFHKSPGCR